MIHLDPGIYPGLPFDEYAALPFANASTLKRARISMAHALVPRKDSTAFDLGHSVHSLILEGLDAFRERTAVWPRQFMTKKGEPSSSRNTGEARRWKAEQEAAGLVILDREEVELVMRVAKNVSECPSAAALLRQALPREKCRELTYVWHDETYDVPCKCRFDGIADETIALDIKTTQSAHHDDFARSVVKYGYHLQAAHYREGYRAQHGRDIDHYVIIAVETTEPYGCAVYELGDEWLDRGWEERDRALEVWADWYHDGRPLDVRPYSPEPQLLPMPRWA